MAEPQASMAGDTPILRAEGLTKRFGGLAALTDFTFHVGPREILGLIGPNGAGKTTTFNLISGFMRPSSGRLIFCGEDITGFRFSTISGRGLVRTFQHQSLLKDMTVLENITVGALHRFPDPVARERRVHEVADLLGLRSALGEMANQLPHGRQRLLGIAIALASQPRLLCLDEPLTGLNSTEVQAALQTMRRIRDEFGIGIILVDHNMRAVMQICDRIIVLNHGQLLAEGSPVQVSGNPEVVAAYLGDAQ